MVTHLKKFEMQYDKVDKGLSLRLWMKISKYRLKDKARKENTKEIITNQREF